MKQTIKNFLFKKRLKILKSKQGFSLIEVLVAVAIIGIISAIAVPQFTANRNEAAKVAMNTSAGNVAKAFKNCVTLKSFGECDSLGKIKVSCPAGATCDSGKNATNSLFCAEIHKGKTGSEFEVCVSVNSVSGAEVRTYDGGLLGKICHLKETDASTPANCEARNSGAEFALNGPQTCTQDSDCGTNNSPDANNCGKTYKCKVSINTADCGSTAGTCG